MTLREILNSILDFNLTPLFEIFGGGVGLLMLIVLPIGLMWFGYSLLKDVLFDEQPHDRDLFAKIFIFISGFFSIGGAFFIAYSGFNLLIK
tara:strand:+ start:347 stop:619 length:273 start_codon:yes stop_codon:yes gene_type:complete